MYDQLAQQQTLLSTLERYASDLKTSHEASKERLRQPKPGSDLTPIASEALELAMQLESRLPPESPTDATETLPLDAAMAFNMGHTPHAKGRREPFRRSSISMPLPPLMHLLPPLRPRLGL